jgi:hypothetical protein
MSHPGLTIDASLIDVEIPRESRSMQPSSTLRPLELTIDAAFIDVETPGTHDRCSLHRR